MQFDKSQVLELLRSQGDEAKARQADEQLPQRVDTDEHSGLLGQLGLDPAMLITKLAGGSGGLGGLLGR
jgi:hypothetical protein